ncbi:MAG: MFS transporter [Candidatus Microsaccharimonas sp.]
MVRKFFRTILERRHFWRYATFSEVAEIYVSRMLRMAALYMAATFMSIYLFQIGYSVVVIALFWTAFFLFKSLMALPIARFVAWIGPKHSALVSNLLYIPAMICFVLLPVYGPWLLLPTAVLQGVSAAMYSIAYLINFSKVKSVENAGKEIAFMNIFEKITTGLSPLVGGFIAFIWGPEVVIVVAAVLFAFAAGPLFKTGEPVKTGQKLQFKGFPWRLFFKHAVGQFVTGFDSVAVGTVWSLYLAIVIFDIATNGDSVYAAMGALVSVVFIVAILASYTYGKLIDRKRGKELMRAGAIASAATHLVRPFIISPVAVAGANASSELATTAISLPYTRGVFDNADLSGVRTTYLGVGEVVSNFGAAIGCLVLAAMTLLLGDENALRYFFFIAAGVALLMLTVRFPLYKK